MQVKTISRSAAVFPLWSISAESCILSWEDVKSGECSWKSSRISSEQSDGYQKVFALVGEKDGIAEICARNCLEYGMDQVKVHVGDVFPIRKSGSTEEHGRKPEKTGNLMQLCVVLLENEEPEIADDPWSFR